MKRIFSLFFFAVLAMTMCVATSCGGDDEKEGEEEVAVPKFKDYQLYGVWTASKIKTSEGGTYKDWADVYGDDVSFLDITKSRRINAYGLFGEGKVDYSIDGNDIATSVHRLRVLDFSPSGEVWTMECEVSTPALGKVYIKFTRDTTPNSHASVVEHMSGQWRLSKVPDTYSKIADQCIYEFTEKKYWNIILHISPSIASGHEYAKYKGQYISIPNSTPRWEYKSQSVAVNDIEDDNTQIALSAMYASTASRYCNLFLSTHVLNSDLTTKGERILATRIGKTVTYTDLSK